MANLKLKRIENRATQFFVDSTCIDCGTCYWMCPKTFQDINDQSAVINDPISETQKFKAYQALYSCPSNSIGVTYRDEIATKVLKEFPFLIGDEVYLNGFHAKSSFGATSYFIKSELGNILIDSPRFLTSLVSKFRIMGGISLQLLTHQDDVADTDLYQNVFKSKRYIHTDDTNSKTRKYEVLLTGEEPLNITEDLIAIPTPGHTKGSICYLYKNKYLFTGDHLAYSLDRKHLIGFKDACWYDRSKLIESMEKLYSFKFSYVLPGHGAPIQLNNEEMRNSLKKCIQYLKE